jgi:hypothetical protein
VTAFYDPAVQFGFQFETTEGAAAADVNDGAQAADKPAPAAARPTPEESKPDAPPSPPENTTGGEVVRLDRFRKK